MISGELNFAGTNTLNKFLVTIPGLGINCGPRKINWRNEMRQSEATGLEALSSLMLETMLSSYTCIN